MDKTLEIINQITTLNKDLRGEIKGDVKEMMADQATVISARLDVKMDEKLKESLDPIKEDINEIKLHNQKQNGWVEDHNRRLEAIDGKDGAISALQAAEISNKQNRKFHRFFKKNWVRAVIGFVVLMYAMHSLFDVISFDQVLEWVAKIF